MKSVSFLLILLGVGNLFASSHINYNKLESSNQLLGKGIEVRTHDINHFNHLLDLNIDFVRLEISPLWSKAPMQIPKGSSSNYMDQYISKYYNFDALPDLRIKELKQSYDFFKKHDIETIFLQYQIPRTWLKSIIGENKIKTKYLRTFATYWGSLLNYFRKHGVETTYITLSNEPDGNWNGHVSPDQYAKLVVYTRKELDRRGFQSVKILGPDTAFLLGKALYSHRIEII